MLPRTMLCLLLDEHARPERHEIHPKNVGFSTADGSDRAAAALSTSFETQDGRFTRS